MRRWWNFDRRGTLANPKDGRMILEATNNNVTIMDNYKNGWIIDYGSLKKWVDKNMGRSLKTWLDFNNYPTIIDFQ